MNPIEPPTVAGAMRIVFAEDQPQYLPLPAMVTADGTVHTAWQLTEDERLAVAAGADIHLSLMTFGQPLSPILLQVGPRPS